MLQSFVHAFSDALLIVDTRGLVVDINESARQLFGTGNGLSFDRPLADLLAIDREETQEFIDQAAASSRFVSWKKAAFPGVRHGSVTLEGVSFNDLEPAVLVRARPASGRRSGDEAAEEEALRIKAVEARLSRSQKRYETLFNAMNDAVFTYQLDERGVPTTFVDVNDTAVDILGYSREELSNMRLTDIVNTERVNLKANLEQLHRHGRLLNDTWYVARDGRNIAMEVSSHLIELSGMPTVLSICRDVSERRRVEREMSDLLRREQIARREAEVAREQLALLVQATSILSDGLNHKRSLQYLADLLVPHLADWCTISLVDGSGDLQQVAVSHRNPALVRAAKELDRKYPSPPDARYGPSAVVRTGDPEFIRRVDPAKLESLAYNEAHAEFLRDLKLNSTLTVPIKLRGRVLGALTLIYADSGRRYTRHDLLFAEELAGRAAREIENARLFRAVENSRDAAEEMSRLKSAFLANMSHEIRTPLTSILGFASLLEQRVADEHRPLAEYIRRGGKRLLETLDAVLSLSQLESDTKQFDLRPLEVGSLAEEIVVLMRPKAEEKGLLLEFERNPEPLIALADSGAVTSVLQNLIGNAIKFTISGHIEVAITETEDVIRIDVTDTGVGMETAFLDHLFQPFYQESTGWSRSYEGSGLGLAITRKLIDKMNGRLEVDTEKNKGSRFSVILAAAQLNRDTPHMESSPEKSGSPEENPRILLVEDNPESGMFMEVLLSEFGEVTLVTNVEEALEVTRQDQNAFDLLILDINLGNGRTGTDLLEELRRREEYVHVPAAAVTAYALPEDRGHLLDAGFDAYLAKPFLPVDLTSLAQDLLSGSYGG